MSEITGNERTHFEQTEELVRFVGEYPDDYLNVWTIDLLGTRDAVSYIKDLQKFVLNAIPEDHGDYYERLANAQKWVEELSPEGEVGEIPPGTDTIPELHVQISLSQVANPGMNHVIDIEFDPPISTRSHRWTFKLDRVTTTFSIGVRQIQPLVGYSTWLSSGGRVGHALVWRISGEGVEYDIETHVGTYVVV